MKKLLVVFVVLTMVCFSSMAFADMSDVSVTVDGSVQIRSRDFENLNFDKFNDAGTTRDTQERIMLDVNAKAGDDVKGKISLWNDWEDWGNLESAEGTGFGSPAKSGIDVNSFGFREAWMNFNVPGIPVNVTAGHQLLQLGNGWFLRNKHYGDDAWVVANVTGPNTVAAVNIKAAEISTHSSDQAIDGYALLDVFKLADNMTVGADLTSVLDRANSLGLGGAGAPGSVALYNLGLNFNGTLGPLVLSAQVDGQAGKTDTALGASFEGNEVVIQGKVPIDPLTIRFTAARGSGDNGIGSTTPRRDPNYEGMQTLLDIDPHYTFLYEYKIPTAAGAANYFGGVHTGFENTTALSLGAQFAASKSVNFGIDVWWLQATEAANVANLVGTGASAINGGLSHNIGWEEDINLNWQLYNNLSWNWVAGYFTPGNVYQSHNGANADAAYGLQGVLALTF